MISTRSEAGSSTWRLLFVYLIKNIKTALQYESSLIVLAFLRCSFHRDAYIKDNPLPSLSKWILRICERNILIYLSYWHTDQTIYPLTNICQSRTRRGWPVGVILFYSFLATHSDSRFLSAKATYMITAAAHYIRTHCQPVFRSLFCCVQV